MGTGIALGAWCAKLFLMADNQRFRSGRKVDPLYFGETRYASAFMLARLRLNDFRCVGLCFLWRNVLIKPKEIAWIVVRFDTDEACPPFAEGLRDPIVFISAHEIDVHPPESLRVVMIGRDYGPRRHCRHLRTLPTSCLAG